jgi:hypothetical protein
MAWRSHLRLSAQVPPKEPAQRHLTLVFFTKSRLQKEALKSVTRSSRYASDLSFFGDDWGFGWRGGCLGCRLRGTLARGRAGGQQRGFKFRNVGRLRRICSGVPFVDDSGRDDVVGPGRRGSLGHENDSGGGRRRRNGLLSSPGTLDVDRRSCCSRPHTPFRWSAPSCHQQRRPHRQEHRSLRPLPSLQLRDPRR